MARGIQKALGKREINYGKEFTLVVEIGSAAEIDDFANHGIVGAGDRLYRATLSVQPGYWGRTKTVKTWTSPTWRETFHFPVDFGSLDYDGSLYLEVERVGWAGSVPDPGTSHGDAVVGRAKVTVPKLGEEKGGRFGLVRTEAGECKAEGFVFLNMKLVKKQQPQQQRWGRGQGGYYD